MSFNKDIEMCEGEAKICYNNLMFQGNLSFENKRYEQAKYFYSKAIKLSLNHLSDINYAKEAQIKVDECDVKIIENLYNNLSPEKKKTVFAKIKAKLFGREK